MVLFTWGAHCELPVLKACYLHLIDSSFPELCLRRNSEAAKKVLQLMNSVCLGRGKGVEVTYMLYICVDYLY